MAAPPNADAPYKKDIVHNLGYNPIVRAYAFLQTHLISGWVKIPVSYYVQVFDEDYRTIIEPRTISYDYIDTNTVRFYGEENTELRVDLFIDPRKDAWYE